MRHRQPCRVAGKCHATSSQVGRACGGGPDTLTFTPGDPACEFRMGPPDRK